MKKRNILFTALLLLLAAPITTHADVVAFEAHVGQITLVSASCNGGVCTFGFEGTGAVNIIGAATISATVVQDFNVTPCNTAVAEITFAGANGSITVSDACGVVCPGLNGFPATIESVWNVTGGTGAFNGITGSGAKQGTLGGHGGQAHLSGVVSY
jgi:hypothetical protein